MNLPSMNILLVILAVLIFAGLWLHTREQDSDEPDKKSLGRKNDIIKESVIIVIKTTVSSQDMLLLRACVDTGLTGLSWQPGPGHNSVSPPGPGP